jgi:MFS family permease
MAAFTVVWVGQVISLLGTGMTRFALIFWAWRATGEATPLGLMMFFSFGPMVLFSPVAGALVDRWNRKLVMMFSDFGAALATAALLLLHSFDSLQLWHLYAAGAIAGTMETFQFPAYSTAVTTMLDQRQYARANGMISLAQAASFIAAPVLGGALLAPIGIGGIMLVDVATSLAGIGALLLVHVPQPAATALGEASRGSLWRESLFGFRYIFSVPSLLAVQLVFLLNNLAQSFSLTVLPAMVLARTGDDALALGSVQSAMGAGGVVGGVLLSLWGGPKRRIHGVLLGWGLAMVGLLLLGLGGGPRHWVPAGFALLFFQPLLNASNQAIWQAKVAPDVQGRVFGARRLIAQISWPLAALFAGVAADRAFEPAMRGGALARALGGVVGTGPGSGMALMFVLSGSLGIAVSLGAYALRIVRDVEDILPDNRLAASVDPPQPPAPGPPPAVAPERPKLEGASTAA